MFKTPKRILLRASLTASAFLLGACTSQAGAAEVESAYVAIVESVPEAEQPYAEELANASDPEPEYHAAGFITMGARTMRMHVNWDNPRSWGFRPSLGRQTGQYSDGWGERSFHPIFRDFYSRVEARRRSEWGDSSVNFASIILQEWPSMLPGAISFFNADGVFDYAGQPMYYTDYLDGNPANPIRAVDFPPTAPVTLTEHLASASICKYIRRNQLS